jgi:hypothetical protein
MSEETKYPVLLVDSDKHVLEGSHTYGGAALPAEGEAINVESDAAAGETLTRTAEVLVVIPEGEFPIRAVIIEPPLGDDEGDE